MTLPTPGVRLASIFCLKALLLKVYRSTFPLLADIECLLASAQPSFVNSPLEEVVDLLCRGRHYAWVGIFLATGNDASQHPLCAGTDGQTQAVPAQVILHGTRCKILISLKLASRELGVLSVESDRENAFGAEDRVLLEGVADALARFLAGRGKYLACKARQQTTASPSSQARVA